MVLRQVGPHGQVIVGRDKPHFSKTFFSLSLTSLTEILLELISTSWWSSLIDIMSCRYLVSIKQFSLASQQMKSHICLLLSRESWKAECHTSAVLDFHTS